MPFFQLQFDVLFGGTINYQTGRVKRNGGQICGIGQGNDTLRRMCYKNLGVL